MLKLKLIYTLHMVLPLRWVHWHIERLPMSTIEALHQAYPPEAS